MYRKHGKRTTWAGRNISVVIGGDKQTKSYEHCIPIKCVKPESIGGEIKVENDSICKWESAEVQSKRCLEIQGELEIDEIYYNGKKFVPEK